MNILILAANGQIARIIETRLLQEPQFKTVHLTLVLRNRDRLKPLMKYPQVTLVEGDITDQQVLDQVMPHQDLVYVAVVDHDQQNKITRNIIAAMQRHQVKRIIATNILGLYQEVPGEFGRWNLAMVQAGLQSAIKADQLLATSGLCYTTLRLPWLNDRNEIKYTVTTHDQPFIGVSGSRQSVADLILRIIATPQYGANDSLGIADSATQGQDRPVY